MSGHAPKALVPSRHVGKCPDPTWGAACFFQGELPPSVNLQVSVFPQSPQVPGVGGSPKSVFKTELIKSSQKGLLVEVGFEEGEQGGFTEHPQAPASSQRIGIQVTTCLLNRAQGVGVQALGQRSVQSRTDHPIFLKLAFLICEIGVGDGPAWATGCFIPSPGMMEIQTFKS